MRRVGPLPRAGCDVRERFRLEVTSYLTRLHGFANAEAQARAADALERVGLGDVTEPERRLPSARGCGNGPSWPRRWRTIPTS